MKCGDKGFTASNGAPCGQNIPPTAKACIWHSRTAAERRELALKGAWAGRTKVLACLPGDTPNPALHDAAGVRQLIADTIQQVRVGKLDHRIAQAVFSGATVALRLAELELAATIGNLERRLGLRA